MAWRKRRLIVIYSSTLHFPILETASVTSCKGLHRRLLSTERGRVVPAGVTNAPVQLPSEGREALPLARLIYFHHVTGEVQGQGFDVATELFINLSLDAEHGLLLIV
uniref:Putative secreted protein n=1 Tax=Anopheles darlingi TaxID=43151 RepID=A0A2M4D818_ANODA